MSCPDENSLLDYARGESNAAKHRAVTEHLDVCAACRALVSELVRARTGDSSASMPRRQEAMDEDARGPLARGQLLGRYVILGPVGSGAMGVVYAAYDPELDRKVALKLLRPRASADPARAEKRLVREAQAMARLSHENVITVHDVNTFGGCSFVAMEFVEGGTLGDYLASRSQGWQDIVRLFLQAGRGVAAAHRAGLVHRDFKPSNVLVYSDGRVRVTDFGLARASGPGALPIGETRSMAFADLSATVEGAAIGTPAYMAPEQFAGAAVDARTDQFAFCVSLYEALYGVRPFAGATGAEIERNIAGGHVQQPVTRREVPAKVRRTLLRGLRGAPDERFPSMEPLLVALGAATSTRHRVREAVAVVTTLLAVLGVLGAHRLVRQRKLEACARPPEMAGLWAAAARARVEQAFLATRLPYAKETFTRVAAVLDRYVTDWTAVRREACALGSLPSPAVAAQRMACLDSRSAALATLVDGLAHGGRATVDRAVESAHALPRLDLARCESSVEFEEQARASASPDRVARLRSQLAVARVSRNLGRPLPGLRAARTAATEARAMGLRAAEAQALFYEAGFQGDVGERKPVPAILNHALALADEARADELRAEIAIALFQMVVFMESRGDLHSAENERLREQASAALRRIGGRPDLEARFERCLGEAERRYGSLDAAARHLERALSVRQAAFGPHDLGLASILSEIGRTWHMRGVLTKASEHYRRALALAEALLSPGHVRLASYHSDLGVALMMQGDLAGAEVEYQRALDIRTAVTGSNSDGVAESLNGFAELRYNQGRYEEARQMIEQAIAIRERVLGPDHQMVALALSDLGLALGAQRKVGPALIAQKRAFAIARRAYGDDHPELAHYWNYLGEALLAAGDIQGAWRAQTRGLALLERSPGNSARAWECLLDRGRILIREGRFATAIKETTRALELLEKENGADSPSLAEALIALGEASLGAGEAARARAVLERAVALWRKSTLDPLQLADAQFLLARALTHGSPKRMPVRARELALSARDIYAKAGGSRAAERRRLARWLQSVS
jgi:tetratricopeptide (TPR) repeat protein